MRLKRAARKIVETYTVEGDVQDYRRLTREVKERDAKLKAIKERLKIEASNAGGEIIVDDGGSVTYKNEPQEKFDKKAAKAELGDQLDPFFTKPDRYVLRVK